MRYEILLMSSTFWDETPLVPIDATENTSSTFTNKMQVTQEELCSDRDDGSYIFLRNIGYFSLD
jgi:hypothetical protein